jgi:hypothetical protein
LKEGDSVLNIETGSFCIAGARWWPTFTPPFLGLIKAFRAQTTFFRSRNAPSPKAHAWVEAEPAGCVSQPRRTVFSQQARGRSVTIVTDTLLRMWNTHVLPDCPHEYLVSLRTQQQLVPTSLSIRIAQLNWELSWTCQVPQCDMSNVAFLWLSEPYNYNPYPL